MSEKRNQNAASGHEPEEAAAVRVECYAGHRAEEAPRRFFIGRREVQVTEIIDRWLDPRSSHFKVRGNDGGIYILRYDQDAGSWDMVLFNSNTRADTRLSST
jgi:hypothetical protein